MRPNDPKLTEQEKQFRALANRRRLFLLIMLKREGEMNVGELASRVRLSFAATSRHLNVLHTSGLVEREQRELYMYYRIPSHPSTLLVEALKDL